MIGYYNRYYTKVLTKSYRKDVPIIYNNLYMATWLRIRIFDNNLLF